ncbi:CHAD domain-containing protein [Henriciella aquimarina]|uniref:CHAD domain-containing protein n=1 Tax=Henriciella aquimarina TaxID=545261 RepID=UPI0009FFBAD8|nr:CHAD domain-containing protein [Henriciella aquimarina]
MAYSFKHADESVEAGFRRIAKSQLESGLEELRGDTLSRPEKVHQIRKRCKKMRGLLRFVRTAFEDYSEENKTLRDAARTLSGVRDSKAVLESLNDLEHHFGTELKKAALDPMRKPLESRREAVDESEVEEKLADMRLIFREALERAEDWSLDETGADAFSASVAKTYSRARKAMEKARKSGKTEDFHEWRKRVKYHWYHARLIRKVWPPVLEGWASEADKLSDDLGDHHDLAVLVEAAEDLIPDKTDTLELVGALCAARQETLAERCFRRGGKMFAETPDAFAARWTKYWDLAA